MSRSIQYIHFYRPKDDYGWANNFYPTNNLYINGERWRSSEQYFQAMKFRGKHATSRDIEYSDIIRETDTPGKAKLLGTQKTNTRFGKKWKINKKTDERLVNDIVTEYSDLKLRSDWHKKRVNIMIDVLLYKFMDKTLAKKLKAIPDNALLVEHTVRDKFWADGGDGGTGKKGLNVLGKILTVISHILKYGSCEYMNPKLVKHVKIVLPKNDKKKQERKKIPKNNIRILSWNVNGIRSNIISTTKYKKCREYSVIEKDSNLGEMVTRYNPDIICLQETRCNEEISGCIKIPGFHQYWNCSQGQGARSGARYSGVTLWSREEPISVEYNVGGLSDKEGRILCAEYSDFFLLSTYVPNAGTNFEYRVNTWDKGMLKFLKKMKKKNKTVIWCGDLNVAPTEKDVHFGYKYRPDGSKNTSYAPQKLPGTGKHAVAGFTKEERDNYKKFIKAGYTNVYKALYPDKTYTFSWWTPRIPAFRVHNKGWLIDHVLISENKVNCVKNIEIITDAGLLTKPQGSDHAALFLEINRECLV